jgi:acyl-homoserine lactone acylase PvdQ
MMRARTAREFDRAATGWRFPSANMVFGDRDGNIGYRTVAAIPVRRRGEPFGGRAAMPGRGTADDWQDTVPGELLPGVLNPSTGVLFSANHRPVGAWYPIPLGLATGSGGDTTRSWRLRERLQAVQKFSPEAVREIYHDSVNPARREIVRLGLHLRDQLRRDLPGDAQQALIILEPWYRAGASSSLDVPGAALAMELSTFFRMVTTDLALTYGGGETGLVYFLKTSAARLTSNPNADLSATEQAFVVESLSAAWQAARQKYGPDPSAWMRRARETVVAQHLGYFESLDGFPSVDVNKDLPVPPLTVVDGGTLASQASQSYTQWVPMHDTDQAMSILPIGESERADAPSRTNMMTPWSQGRVHPAPLSRARVQRTAVSRRQISMAGVSRP